MQKASFLLMAVIVKLWELAETDTRDKSSLGMPDMQMGFIALTVLLPLPAGCCLGLYSAYSHTKPNVIQCVSDCNASFSGTH